MRDLLSAMEQKTIEAPVTKVATSITAAAVGALSWSDIAAILAAVYSSLLIAEWMWKRVFHPIAVRRRWIKTRVKTIDEFARESNPGDSF